jgi:hypothetical protein
MDQLLGDDGAPGHSAANAAGRSLGTGDHDKRPFKTTEVVRRRADLTVYRFHHTSLVDGGKVIGVGEWIVRKGKLWKINANSGHYQPTIDFLYRAVLNLALAFQSDTTVFLYDSVADETTVRWELRPGEIEGSLRP